MTIHHGDLQRLADQAREMAPYERAELMRRISATFDHPCDTWMLQALIHDMRARMAALLTPRDTSSKACPRALPMATGPFPSNSPVATNLHQNFEITGVAAGARPEPDGSSLPSRPVRAASAREWARDVLGLVCVVVMSIGIIFIGAGLQ